MPEKRIMTELKITVVSGSARPQRQSHQVAEAVLKRLQEQPGVQPWLLDVKELQFPLLEYVFSEHPNPPEQMQEVSSQLRTSNGIVLVSPEHNGSYSGALKNTLDYFYKEYEKKVFGIVTVSSGALGGISAALSLQRYGLRLQGYVSPQMLLTPKVQTLFTNGTLTDEAYGQRMDKFLQQFLWLTRAIAHAEKDS